MLPSPYHKSPDGLHEPRRRDLDGREITLLCRDRLDHEHVLLSERMTWIVMSNAWLFTAFAVSLGSAATPGPYGPALRTLVRLLPWVAIASLVTYYISVTAALFAMSRLHRFIDVHDDQLLRSAIVGGPTQRVSGLAAQLLLPVIFLATWVEALRLV
jgi:hypothetical protein